MTTDKPGPPETPKARSEADQKLWQSAHDVVHNQNHYMKGEGPTQALGRLKKQGFLEDLAIDDIAKVAHAKVKAELGAKGEKHRNYYTTHDAVMAPEKENEQIDKLFEKTKKHEQAERLSPTVDQIRAGLTPDVQDKLTAAGLKVDPQKLRDAIFDRLNSDKGLSSDAMEKMKIFPVGAPYVATGAVDGTQMDGVISEQKAARDAWQNDKVFQDLKGKDPDEYKKQWTQFLKDTDVGALLRRHPTEDPQHYNSAKIEAADALIKQLQNQMKPKG